MEVIGAFWILLIYIMGVCSGQVSVQAEKRVVELPKNDNALNTFASLVCFVTPQRLDIPIRWITPNEDSVEHSTGQYLINLGQLEEPNFGSLLIIRDISYQSAGLYICEAMDNETCFNFPKFATVQLVLKMRLEAKERSVSVIVKSGEQILQIELQWEATGYVRPQSDFHLYREGTELLSNEKYTISFNDGRPNMAQVGSNETSPSLVIALIIHNVTLADMGKYTCRSQTTQEMASTLLFVENEPILLPASSAVPGQIIPTVSSQQQPPITSLPSPSNSVKTIRSSNTDCSVSLTVAVLCTFALSSVLAVLITLAIIYLWLWRKNTRSNSNISSPNTEPFPMPIVPSLDKGMVDIYQISTGDEIEESNGMTKESSLDRKESP